MSHKFDCIRCSYSISQHVPTTFNGKPNRACPSGGLFEPTKYYKERHMSDGLNDTKEKIVYCPTCQYPVAICDCNKTRTMQQLIQNALDGKRGKDQQRIAEVGLAFVTTLLKKNNDYGSSIWKKPLLAPNTDVAAAILVRMTDKVERLISLQQKKSEVTEESFDDTMKDLGAYALLYLARPKN